jgi:hypothetical protein
LKPNEQKGEPTPQKQSFTSGIYEIEHFPEFKWLSDQYQIILKELGNIDHHDSWIEWWRNDGHEEALNIRNYLMGDWTVYPVYFNRKFNQKKLDAQKENARLKLLNKSLFKTFPNTISLLKQIKGVRYAWFSRLAPKSKLAPHVHVQTSATLIFHLGLVIPANKTSGLSVDGRLHVWEKPGESIVFDDTFTHSAWNDSDQDRIILYVNFAPVRDCR